MKTKLFAAAFGAVLLTVSVWVAAIGAARTTASPFDQHWLRASVQGDRYEIAVGKLVLQKGTGQACQIGQMLVSDHGKSLRETTRVARKAGVSVPGQPSPVEQAIIQELAKQSGTGFQSMFTIFGLGDHKQDITDAREAAVDAQLTSVRSLARQELPTLRKHLAALEKLAKSTSAAAAGAATNPSTTSGNGPTTTQPDSTTTTTGPAGTTTAAASSGGCSGNPTATAGK